VEGIKRCPIETQERKIAGTLHCTGEEVVKNEEVIGSVRRLIEDCLRDGAVIDIDGIGYLELDPFGELTFKRNETARVFLAYAREDRRAVKRLYEELQAAGFEPWMDTENLLPGQNWSRAIERAIEISDYFVGCFSTRSALKRGHFQSELAYALDVATRVPLEQAFFVPVRLDECEMPDHIAKRLHYVNLYPEWKHGIQVLVKALRAHQKGKKRS
jgi:hypothetical protein